MGAGPAQGLSRAVPVNVGDISCKVAHYQVFDQTLLAFKPSGKFSSESSAREYLPINDKVRVVRFSPEGQTIVFKNYDDAKDS